MQAVQLARDLEPYRLFFLEDALRPEYPETFKLLRQHTITPLAMGELYNTLWECLPIITNQWIDYIRVDLERVGGITAARKLAAIAEPYYVRTAWHGPIDLSPIGHTANVHVDMAIPNFGIQEHMFWDRPRKGGKDEFIWLTGDSSAVLDVFRGGAQFQGGHLTVSETPGLGVDIDEGVAARFPYKRAYLPHFRHADDKSMTDW